MFVATIGPTVSDNDGCCWGEGHFRVNGVEVARIDDAKDRRHAFREMSRSRGFK